MNSVAKVCHSWLCQLSTGDLVNKKNANSNNCPSESFLSSCDRRAGQVGTMVTINTPVVCRNPRSPRIMCPRIALHCCIAALHRCAEESEGWRPRRLQSLRLHTCDAALPCYTSLRRSQESHGSWAVILAPQSGHNGWEKTANVGKHVTILPETGKDWFLTLPRHGGSAIPIGSNGHRPSTK